MSSREKTESLEHTGAAVIGGASANADDEVAAAFFDGVPDDFAHAIGCGKERIAFGSRYQRDSGRHRYISMMAVFVFSIRPYWQSTGSPKGPVTEISILFSLAGGNQGIHGSLSAVGQRPERYTLPQVKTRRTPAAALFPGFQGGQASLKRIRWR